MRAQVTWALAKILRDLVKKKKIHWSEDWTRVEKPDLLKPVSHDQIFWIYMYYVCYRRLSENSAFVDLVTLN
jgi:hypothetical protein